jgi:hypothetical protein
VGMTVREPHAEAARRAPLARFSRPWEASPSMTTGRPRHRGTRERAGYAPTSRCTGPRRHARPRSRGHAASTSGRTLSLRALEISESNAGRTSCVWERLSALYPQGSDEERPLHASPGVPRVTHGTGLAKRRRTQGAGHTLSLRARRSPNWAGSRGTPGDGEDSGHSSPGGSSPPRLPESDPSASCRNSVVSAEGLIARTTESREATT